MVACPHCKQHRLSMHAGRVMGYAVEMALSCDSCGKELDRRFSPRKMATDPNITRQPFRVNRRAVLAAKEGGFCQIGLTRVTAIMNITRRLLPSPTRSSASCTASRPIHWLSLATLYIVYMPRCTDRVSARDTWTSATMGHGRSVASSPHSESAS